MDDGVLSIPAPVAGQVQVRLAPLADRDMFDPAGWRHENLQPSGTAGWFECDLNGLGLADGEYEYELVIDGHEDAPVPDPFARAITRFNGYRGLFSVAGGVLVPDRFRWDDEFPGGMGLPQNNRLVVYEMPVRWMTGEDTSGPDGSPGIRQVGLGRFEQVRFQHLEDLARLGVNAIELMPIQDSPDTLNWGYGTRFFFAPDLDMGTPTDLKCLVKRCHQARYPAHPRRGDEPFPRMPAGEART